MADLFISYAAEDRALAAQMASALEAQGFSTWYYDRDTVPGVSYLIQTGTAIQSCRAILLIISAHSINSSQVTKEVVRGHETGKAFIPLLVDMSHEEFQDRQPEWREAIGSAASMRLPSQGLESCLPRLIKGLQTLSVQPSAPPLRRVEATSKRSRRPKRAATPDKEPSPILSPAGTPGHRMPEHRLRQPFGEESCENEVALLKESYVHYYFNEAPFNADSVDPDTYLIVGRRGCGKTSLAQDFHFQTLLKNARAFNVDEPRVYDLILAAIPQQTRHFSGSSNAWAASIWECLVWSLVFAAYRDLHPDIGRVCPSDRECTGPVELLEHLLTRLLGDQKDALQAYMRSSLFLAARDAALRITEGRPVIVSVDTLEKYNRENEAMMMVTTALIECASHFNLHYAPQGIHVKAFLSAEIFPHIKESAISNTSKFIRNELYLHWRPKDLMRLVCWRLHSYLVDRNLTPRARQDQVDWGSFPDVLANGWTPYFGETLRNTAGLEEKTFPYVLRHTQMRPRQLVIICNQIARFSRQMERFPEISGAAIVKGVTEAQRRLSDEVLNSYSEIYPNVTLILDALRGLPMVFDGQLLDKVAPTTASEWPRGSYSPSGFKRLVSELGVVGTVRAWDQRARVIEADFEYALDERLPIGSRSKCVIHPMFHAKLQTTLEEPLVVYPFPDHPAFAQIA